MLKKLDRLRTKYFKKLTQNMGKTKLKNKINPEEIKSVLIVRPNHRLGNQLLITPLAQEIQIQFPNASIEVFTKSGLAPIIFKNYPQVKRALTLPKKHFKQLGTYFYTWLKLIFKKYDLVINPIPSSSSGTIATLISGATYKFFTNEFEISENYQIPEVEHIAIKPILHLRSYIGGSNQASDLPGLSLELSKEELQIGKQIVAEKFNNNQPTIALFTYATGSKCYGPDFWKPTLDCLKDTFSNYNILEILPVENISQLDFTTINYYGTEIREMAAVIASTQLFIGADSGIMHLAASTNTPVIGLFSRHNANVYKPYGQYNVAISTYDKTNEESIIIIKETASLILNKNHL